MNPFPLQYSVPGNPELVVIGLVGLLFLALPALAVAILLVRKRGVDEERVERLEREVERLREERRTTDGPDDGLE